MIDFLFSNRRFTRWDIFCMVELGYFAGAGAPWLALGAIIALWIVVGVTGEMWRDHRG